MHLEAIAIREDLNNYHLSNINIYLQALLRQWRRLGLMDAPRSVLSMTMNMALVSSDCFEKALSIIQLEVNQISSKYPAIHDFLAYVHKTWLPLATKVSVYDCPTKTNNREFP